MFALQPILLGLFSIICASLWFRLAVISIFSLLYPTEIALLTSTTLIFAVVHLLLTITLAASSSYLLAKLRHAHTAGKENSHTPKSLSRSFLLVATLYLILNIITLMININVLLEKNTYTLTSSLVLFNLLSMPFSVTMMVCCSSFLLIFCEYNSMWAAPQEKAADYVVITVE